MVNRPLKLGLQVVVCVAVPPLAAFLGIVDVIRRPDLIGPERGLWVVLLVVLPVIGGLLYISAGGGSLW